MEIMKTFIFLLIIISSLFGATTLQKLKFESGISFYGKVGFVDVVFQEDTQHHTYKIEAQAYSTGLVKVLSQNRKDSFVSEGSIEEGVYKPHSFTRITTKNGYKKVTRYSFDYTRNIVKKTVEQERRFTRKSFDPIKFTIVEVPQVQKETNTQELPLVANDYLSLYLNFKHKKLHKGALEYIDKNKTDKVLLLEESLFEVQKHNGKEKYRIVLKEDEKSIFFQEALSLNVAFYGDAYIKKVWEKKE